jgi:hypothetical protein
MGLIIPVTVATAVDSLRKTARYRRVLIHGITKPFMNPNYYEEALNFAALIRALTKYFLILEMTVGSSVHFQVGHVRFIRLAIS